VRILALAAALALAGCATTYELTLMPPDRGVTYTGVAHDNGGGEGPISIKMGDRAYSGTWVQATPSRSSAYVSGGWGWGGWYHGGMGAVYSVDNPQGGQAKALLTAPDGSGLRCDLRINYGYGDGLCRDDSGRPYDVQIRSVPSS